MPPSVFPTGVTVYKPDKAYNCFILFDGRDQKSYLIDMNGHDVKTWNYTGFPSEMIDPKLTRVVLAEMCLYKRSPTSSIMRRFWR
jgi:hypothetical protein